MSFLPYAILNIELHQPYVDLDNLESMQQALVVFRLNGRPVKQVWLQLGDEKVDNYKLRAAAEAVLEQAQRQHHLEGFLKSEATLSHNNCLPATIAICTRDRPTDLRRCLDALMNIVNDGQDILVIDNCPSTDQTYRVVADYPHVRYIREDRAGLNFARNRALQQAQHDIVAFIDDDAVADSVWLGGLLANFADPLVGCVTGLTMPIELQTEPQYWFERYSSFGRGFERIVYDSVSISPTAAGMVGAGVNMALRRSIVAEVGLFNEIFDAGTPTHSGGDYEMFSRILAAGYRIVYDPAALNWHRHRRSWEELRKALYGYGVGVYAFYTHSLITKKEFGALKSAFAWFWYSHFPKLRDALLHRRTSVPLSLVMAELQGCFAGPRAYFASCKQLREKGL